MTTHQIEITELDKDSLPSDDIVRGWEVEIGTITAMSITSISVTYTKLAIGDTLQR